MFKEPASVHVGHRSGTGSSRCPNKNCKLIEPVTQDVAEEMDECQRDVDLVQLIINKIIGLVC